MAYVEDLMGEQARRGHEVSYFFSGRQYPLVLGPRLRQWTHRGIRMLEVVNSPLFDHGRQPELESSEPRIEHMLNRLLSQIRPDVVHVHELAGLPFSVLDVARGAGIPVVVTLQDYFPLCSTFKLLDANGRVCMRKEIGADCAATTAADPRDPGLLFEATLRFEVGRVRLFRRLSHSRLNPWIERGIKMLAAEGVKHRRRILPDGTAPASFQRRREMNVRRLNDTSCVVAMSTRVAEIYGGMGVARSRLRIVQLTLAHIERLRPRTARPGQTMTFGTLAGFESEAKGALLLLEAMRLLGDLAAQGRLRLVVLGHVDAGLRKQAQGVAGIEIRDRYSPSELDDLLEKIDVGIMPSIWEEAYGYAGVEFLAKGIPIIANAIGGMTDYTREGETGWLNHSCTGIELAEHMRFAVYHPEEVSEVSAKIVDARGSIVKTLAAHSDEMDDLYREVLGQPAVVCRPG